MSDLYFKYGDDVSVFGCAKGTYDISYFGLEPSSIKLDNVAGLVDKNSCTRAAAKLGANAASGLTEAAPIIVTGRKRERGEDAARWQQELADRAEQRQHAWRMQAAKLRHKREGSAIMGIPKGLIYVAIASSTFALPLLQLVAEVAKFRVGAFAAVAAFKPELDLVFEGIISNMH